MCGICGVWKSGKGDAVEPMIRAMHHRGPDDRGMFRDDNVALGMTRLAIIDTSSGGHQPMQTPDGQITLVYNGELYNFRTERELLEARGYSFKSSSDTEVVLRMYEHYGDDFLLRMRGMFALAVYDKRRGPGHERLLLARDHLGIKPLLFAWRGSQFVFSSELKAMLASGIVKPEIDPVGLRLLLTYGSVYQPRTLIKDVQMLLPAHRLIVENRQHRIERYWSLGVDRNSSLRGMSYEDHIREVRRAIDESVRLQLVSDVPLGAFLSGGVDSALLVALMARQLTDRRVKTFSVGFEDEGRSIDETDDAAAAAQHIGTDHERVVVTGRDLRDRIVDIARALDQPTVDGVNSYFVSMAARRRVTVAISGTGGDELFAGYPWFAQVAEMEPSFHTWKRPIRNMLAPAVRLSMFDSISSAGIAQRITQLRYSTDFRTRYASKYNVFGTQGAARMLSTDLRAISHAGRAAHYDFDDADELPHGTIIERVTGICLRGYTANQLLRDIDAASMSQSLEVRVPFLDPIVIDTALSLPDNAKLFKEQNGSAAQSESYRTSGVKRILLDIAKPLLPEGFDRKPKRGFGMPFGNWLRGPLRETMDDTLSPEMVRRRGFFDIREAARVHDDFLMGRCDWSRVWVLMMLELWCREFVDNGASLASAQLKTPALTAHRQ